ncbi:MAG: hypothetical protein ACLGIO_08835 [Acidimicrobiia bacterium]
MGTVGRWAAVAALVLAPALAGDPAAADDLVAVEGPTRRALPEAPRPSFGFPVSLPPAGAAAASIDAQVLEVLAGDRLLPEASVEVSVDREGRRLVLAVLDDHRFAEAGEYTITALLVAGDHRQSVTLTLVRPAARLSATATVEVEAFDSLPIAGRWPGDDGGGVLPLGVDRGAPLVSLAARQVEPGRGRVVLSAACDGDAPCRLDEASPVVLAAPGRPDGVVRLDYELEGFPLGTTTRTVEIRSPQLAAPTTVAFEVTRRRSPVLIPLVVVAGVATGWLVRTALTGAIARGRLARSRRQLVEELDRLHRRYADEGLRAELDRLRRDAAEASDEKGPEAVRKEVSELLSAADDRLAGARRRLDAVAAPVAGTWTLPPAVAEALRDLRQAVMALEDRLRVGDARGAVGQAATAENLLHALEGRGRSWIDGLAATLAQLERAIAGAQPGDGIDVLNDTVARARGQAATADGDGPREVLRRCQALLGHADDVLERAVAVVEARAARDQELARSVLAALRAGPDPEARLRHATPLLAELLRMPAPTAATGATVRESRLRRVADGDAPVGERADLATAALDLGARGAGAPAAPYALSLTLSGAAELARAAILAVLLAVAAYATYGSGWVGTLPDVVTVFGWAFALDLSVEAVQAAFTGVDRAGRAGSAGVGG